MLEYNEVKFKQNSKGLWVCDGITINCSSIMDGIELADRAMIKVNKILRSRNKNKKSNASEEGK